MKTIFLASTMLFALAGPVAAQSYGDDHDPMPVSAFPRSALTNQTVFIPPYRRPFPVRVYTTPQREPFYNVPPYAVISPY